jgi:hypothetical protein
LFGGDEAPLFQRVKGHQDHEPGVIRTSALVFPLGHDIAQGHPLARAVADDGKDSASDAHGFSSSAICPAASIAFVSTGIGKSFLVINRVQRFRHLATGRGLNVALRDQSVSV